MFDLFVGYQPALIRGELSWPCVIGSQATLSWLGEVPGSCCLGALGQEIDTR